MREIRPIDPNSVYAKGYDAVLLDREHYHCLLNLVQESSWVADPEGIFSRVPTWSSTLAKTSKNNKIDQETASNKWTMQNAPSLLIEACTEILKSPSLMGCWQEAYQAQMTFISLWDGAEDLDWHWDGPAQSDFFFLIYLNKNPGWPEGCGGELITGERDIASGYLKTTQSVIHELERIKPASRTMVCCNNQNPRFVHKVLPLRKENERTVLMIGFNLMATMSRQL